jgi:hypothetical protein
MPKVLSGIFFKALLKFKPRIPLDPALLIVLLRLGFLRRILRTGFFLFLAIVVVPFFAAALFAGFLVTLRLTVVLFFVARFLVVLFFVARFFVRLLRLDGFSKSISFIPLCPPS